MIQILKILFFLVASAVCNGYLFSEIFIFPEPKPFTGNTFYNPYQNGNQHLLKANFHAHSKSWGGLTNGSQSGDEVLRHYMDAGYDIATVSDYHRINEAIYMDDNISIPCYEHGINIQKTHYMALNAKKVSFQDVFLFHSDHTRQTIINKLSENSDLVCINHPQNRMGHKTSSLRKLDNYSHIELINGSNIAKAHWDSALSSGKPIWALSNDDIHDVKESKFGKSWTAVSVQSKDQRSVLQSLKNGSTFAVLQHSKNEPPQGSPEDTVPIPMSIKINNDTLEIVFRDSIQNILLIGQGGFVRFSAKQKNKVQMALNPADTYIRGQFTDKFFHVFSNPIIRVQSNSLPINNSGVKLDIFRTSGFRILVFTFWIILFRLIFPSRYNQIVRLLKLFISRGFSSVQRPEIGNPTVAGNLKI